MYEVAARVHVHTRRNVQGRSHSTAYTVRLSCVDFLNFLVLQYAVLSFVDLVTLTVETAGRRRGLRTVVSRSAGWPCGLLQPQVLQKRGRCDKIRPSAVRPILRRVHSSSAASPQVPTQ